MIINCPKCDKVWEYRGDNNFYVTCPDCRKLIKMNSHQRPKEEADSSQERRISPLHSNKKEVQE
jgi:acetyl-CoA carboxylase beta subunit